MLQSVAVFVFAFSGLDVDWDPGRVAMVAVMVVAGAVIFAAVWVAGATIAFWTVDGGEFTNAFTYGGNFLSQYPISIYGEWLRRFLAFIVPMAFVCYFPSLYILDKEDSLGLPTAFQFASPVVALAACRRRGARLEDRRAPLPERRLVNAIELRDVRKAFVVRAKKGRVRRERQRRERRRRDHARGRGGRARSATSARTAPGKSTTIKMLTGILVPTAGEVRVAGLDPSRQRIELTRRIGVVFGQRVQLWWDLPLRDSFELLRHVYRVPRARATRRTSNVSPSCSSSTPFLGTPVRQLSLGQRVRGELAAALLHDPELVFLDEPTIGLDVVAKQRVRSSWCELNRERGVTVVLTTHDLGDIERLCSRLVVIDHGRVIWDGAIEELKRRHGRERTLVVDLEEPAPPLEIPGARVVKVEGPRQWLSFRGDEVSAAELTAAVAARAPLVDLAIEETEIEEIVRRIYEAGGDA